MTQHAHIFLPSRAPNLSFAWLSLVGRESVPHDYFGLPFTDVTPTPTMRSQIEVPLLARRPIPAVVHDRAVEFGTISDGKKAYGAVSLANKGSRKATFSVAWDKTLPLVFNPSEVRGFG